MSKPLNSRKSSVMPQLPIDPFQSPPRPRKNYTGRPMDSLIVLRRNSQPKLSKIEIEETENELKPDSFKGQNEPISSARTVNTNDLSQNKKIKKPKKHQESTTKSTIEQIRTGSQKVEIQDRRIVGVLLKHGSPNGSQKFGSMNKGDEAMLQRIRDLQNKNVTTKGEYRVMGDRIFKFAQKE